MLYLDKLIIHNFKSFRNATVRFSKGFNCIVGPNGSGKSNICDSLLFALGEGSLRRMRATSTSQLVSEVGLSRKEKEGRKAYVSMVFGGDSEVTVTRIIKPNGKIAYKLNGNRMTRQEVLDYLRSNNCMVSDTNTITQGEIVKMLEFNPKERRELIDIASGIREFDDKKEASQKELQAVEEKITNTKVLLNERLGFLDELKKEKEAAEKYAAVSSRLKSANYTILYRRSESIKGELKLIIEKLAQSEESSRSIGARILELDAVSEKLASQRNEKAKMLNEKSSALNDSNRKLEEVKRNIAVAESETNSISAYLETAKSEIAALKEESKKQAEKLDDNKAKLPAVEQEIAKLKKELEAYRTPASSEESKNEMDAYEKSMKLFESLSLELETENKRYMSAKMRISEVESQRKSFETEIEKLSKSISEYKKSEQETASASNRGNRELSEARNELDKLKARKKALETELQQISERRISLRESIATYGSDTNRAGKILSEKLRSGFYGRAVELCRYDERYAEAVNAAAGARLSYFVVDSVDVADKAVKILRENKLGRASFIPLDIISYTETRKIEEGDPLIDYVEYEAKFAAAFKFILSNTYLVGDIRSVAKGSRHRFVTMEGELLEQSGVVSGGFSKSFNYAKAVAELKSLEANEKSIREEIDSLQALEEDARQRFGKAETLVMSSSMELEGMRVKLKGLEEEKESLTRQLKSLEDSIKGDSDEYANAENRISELEKKLAEAKKESSERYSKISSRFGTQDAGKSKEKENKAKEYSETLEKRMMERAAIGKENELLSVRLLELKREIDDKELAVKKNGEKRAELEEQLKSLRKSAAELEEGIKAHDKKSAGIYEEIKKIEDEIAKNGYEKGRLSSEKDRMERDAIGMQATKAQLQTRLSDIMAELSGYEEHELLEGDIETLEKELYKLKAEIESMGSVNMRAPEMYSEKSKDVEGVQEKIMTLENERNSILSMIDQLESRKLEVFNDTFNKVNQKFKSLYQSVFPGGEGSVILDSPRNPFNSGLGFDIKEGKSTKRTERLSGGEKSMVMLILIFSIQMCRPLAFYIFDEIDVALDKENSKKLSALIKQLSSNSQFVVVSHNDTLISYADTAIGVAKKDSESRVYGVEIVSAHESAK
ncbi:MAG: chromosome segregation protein SMC [Candidatus Marsarchaeota archaeon]|nr:chromosome segregation protein SMC [Candidatus Marsarchaeota archaeon]